MATDQTDSELDEIQDRVDEIRGRLADNPGLDMVDEDDVPAYFDDGDDHQGHAPG